MRNILALIGFIALVVVVLAFVQFKPYYPLYQQLDSESKAFIFENLDKISAMESKEVNTYIAQIKSLDKNSYNVYTQMADSLLKTGNSAEATVWKFPVEEDITAEDVAEAMLSVANELNFANVGRLPLSADISAKMGKEHRLVEIFLFCDSLIAAKMLDFSDAFSAYLPCRITLIEDKTGKLWLYTLNMDMMISGGKTLPPALLESALKVKETILTIMKRGAAGDF